MGRLSSLSSLILRALPSYFHLLEHHNCFPKCPPPFRDTLESYLQHFRRRLAFETAFGIAIWLQCACITLTRSEWGSPDVAWRGSSNGRPYFPESAFCFQRWGSSLMQPRHAMDSHQAWGQLTQRLKLSSRRQRLGREANGNVPLLSLLFCSIPWLP